MTLKAIFYDTETTGINSKKDRIIEIAAFDPLLDKSLVRLVNPECPIPAEASAIHGITDDMVKDEPTFDVIGQEFIDFCQGDVVLIAHNNDNFDIHFLRMEFGRADVEMPDWKFLDSLKWARKYRPDLPRHSLQFLREMYGITANQAHRALDDVDILYKIFSLMVDDLSLETIMELLSQTSKTTTMPFGKHRGKRLEDLPKDYLAWLLDSGALDKPENALLRETLEELDLLSPCGSG